MNVNCRESVCLSILFTQKVVHMWDFAFKYNIPPCYNTIFKVQKMEERKTKDKQQNSRQLFVF